MPQNVRNFWIELDIDGRTTSIASGPRSRDGGFSLRIYQRDQGNIIKALEVEGIAQSDGSLVLEATTPLAAPSAGPLFDSVDRVKVQTRR